MTRTFLVAVEIDPQDDPSVVANDILESLQTDGISATSVSPWSSPSYDTSPTSPASGEFLG